MATLYIQKTPIRLQALTMLLTHWEKNSAFKILMHIYLDPTQSHSWA